MYFFLEISINSFCENENAQDYTKCVVDGYQRAANKSPNTPFNTQF